MKKNRIHIYITLSIFIITFIIGSFVDQALSAGLFSRNNTFGLICSTIGTIPGYGVFSITGGMLLSLILYRSYSKIWKVMFGLASVVLVGVSIFFIGREFFSSNGFENEKLYFLGFVITLPIVAGLYYLGFRMGKSSDNPQLLFLIIVIVVGMFLALVPGVTLIKGIFHRPRYRSITNPEVEALGGIQFYSWWERCTNYKELMNSYGLTKEEFKSFPSGHAGASACFMFMGAFLPLINKKYEKLRVPMFYIGLGWCLFISFTRILVGAHFLSDVSMGAMLSLICLLISNEVLIANKKMQEYSLSE